MASAELNAVLTGSDIETAASKLRRDFARFNDLTLVDKKALLSRYVDRIIVSTNRDVPGREKTMNLNFFVKGMIPEHESETGRLPVTRLPKKDWTPEDGI